jgi:Putative  PD-(D/E)XK family member, (DUF4420)
MRWSASDLRRILATAAAATPNPDEKTYQVVGEFVVGHARLLVALSPQRDPTLLVTGVHGHAAGGFATRALRVQGHPAVDFDVGGTQFSASAIAVACVDEHLLDVFAPLGVELGNALASTPAPTATMVVSLLQRWSRLFASAARLTEAEELGLWGELWTLNQSAAPDVLVRGWRGSDGGTYDFFVEEARLEVKASRQPGVHHVSLTQVDPQDGSGILLSLAAEHSATGQSVADLARSVFARLPDATPLLEALTRHDLSLATLDEASTRYRLLVPPMVFALATVPRVLAVDPGVSSVRYVVHLHGTPQLEGDALASVLGRFGLTAIAETM